MIQEVYRILGGTASTTYLPTRRALSAAHVSAHGHGPQQSSKPQIGFGSSQGKKSKDDLFNELEEYYMDFKKNQDRVKQTGDPNEKEHALLELKEFASIMQEIMSKIAKAATTPEEKQYLQQMATKLQQEIR